MLISSFLALVFLYYSTSHLTKECLASYCAYANATAFFLAEKTYNTSYTENSCRIFPNARLRLALRISLYIILYRLEFGKKVGIINYYE